MPLTTVVTSAQPAGYATPLLAVAVPAGAMPASLAQLDAQGSGAIGRLYASGAFAGKKDEHALLHPGGPAARVLLLGLWKVEDAGRTGLRRVAAAALM